MRLLVLYGSQTGTAQDVAEKIWRESKSYSFTGPFMSMDDYEIENLIKEQLVIFVASTTGQGEEPDNMKKFWKFLLRKSLPTSSLQNLKFACVGLGDSSYPKYNFPAKKLNKRLIQLSASPIVPLGLCDDQHDHGMAASLLPWIQNVWSTLKQMYPHLKENSSNEFCFKWNVWSSNKSPCANLNNLKWPLKENPLNFEVMENVRTTSEDHFQDVRLIKLKYPPKSTWNPGDILQVRPSNSDEKVDELFDILGEHNLSFNRNTTVEFKENHEDLPLPLPYQHPVTLGLLAKYVWDLSCVPRQSAFGLLALNCKDELEKEKLEEFTTAEGLEELIAYANRPRRSILEVLYDFRHATAALTLPILLELFQIIQPRSFSIASVPENGTLDILVAIVEYKTKLSTPRRGLCSNWLRSIAVGDEILGTIKKGTLMFPKDCSTPMILVGPGTGIAPFLSIMALRETETAENNVEEKSIVFFGCRNKEKDYFCREYFERFEATGVARCFTAFSRDQENKVYVQHMIKDNGSLLKDLILNKTAVVMVAGSSKNMPKSVKEAFIELLGDELYIEKMIKTNRYQEETWS